MYDLVKVFVTEARRRRATALVSELYGGDLAKRHAEVAAAVEGSYRAYEDAYKEASTNGAWETLEAVTRPVGLADAPLQPSRDRTALFEDAALAQPALRSWVAAVWGGGADDEAKWVAGAAGRAVTLRGGVEALDPGIKGAARCDHKVRVKYRLRRPRASSRPRRRRDRSGGAIRPAAAASPRFRRRTIQ